MCFLRRASPVLLILSLWFAPVPEQAQPANLRGNSTLHSMGSLGTHASFHTDITFDNKMLRELARGLPSDQEAHRIVSNLDSVTVHIYRYSRPGLYKPADLSPLRNHYRVPEWKHLVAVGPSGQKQPARTDLWIRFRQGNVEAMALLHAEPKTLDIVEITGKLSPFELLHLRGHFGIPRFPADHFADDSGRQFLAEER